ncbi:hypothetical protein Tco_0821246 [Tanacetum coccineum]|uniref:Uncharacterized protein n=1 Tax=Tanacetum coccineum TaxID=301880 RepID=A0ABQ5AEB8_9ASTR
MSSATSAVTYTSVYTNSEPDRAFWGADDEEISEGGIPRVIVLGYGGSRLDAASEPPPITDYILAQKDPQHRQFLRDEDENEFPAVESHYLLLIHLLWSPVIMLLKSDPEEDLRSPEDDETKDVIRIGDRSEDDGDEEVQEHLARADLLLVGTCDELFSTLREQSLLYRPPSTDITYWGGIGVPSASDHPLSYPPMAEVERDFVP